MADGKNEGERKDTDKPAEPAGPSTPIAPPASPGTPAPQAPAAPAAPVAPAPVSGELVETDDHTWEAAVEKSKKPVAVMFYSPTCVFCHQIEPYFRHYAQEYKDTVIFARLNVMASLWTAERYGVRSTPTFKFFCNGKPVLEIVGAVYPAILKKLVEETLLHGKECKESGGIDYEITGYG